jgi:arylesterase/paraoxonase
MRMFLSFVGLALTALTIYVSATLIPVSGAMRRFEDKLVDQCRRIDVAPGTEDVTFDPTTGLAFVSSDDRRANLSSAPVQGGIYAFSSDAPETVVKVSPDSFGDFHPHGVSLWRGANGEKRLFVINHAAKDKVEIFDVADGGMLTHLESVAFEAMNSPNDVLGVGPRQFYATNDRGYKNGLLSTLEAYLALPFASLVYFDGAKGEKVARGLVFANGVNVSPKGDEVYVSELLRRRVSVYARDAQTGALSLTRRLKTMTNPDNIEVADDGALWIGGHPRIFEFLKHAEDAAYPAPSEIVRLDPKNGAERQVFLDTKGRLNASSVGAVHGDTLIVGAVFDGHVMLCPLASASPTE